MPDHLSVDPRRCVACGLCRRLAPHLFTLENRSVAMPAADLIDGPLAEEAREVAMACPTEAVNLRPIR